jgi:hypothetical protein
MLKKLNEEVTPMAEYINKQELLKEIDDLKKSPWYNDSYGFGLQQARHDGVNVVVDLCIKQAPAADVVEVVRCSECQHWGGVTFGFICRKFSGESTKICMHADGYCSYGEMRSV